MYKVAVITMGIRLDDEKGYTRFRSVCEFLADAGYQVDLITTTFQHWKKHSVIWKKLKMKNTNLGSSSFMSRDIRKILIYVESIVIELQQRT